MTIQLPTKSFFIPQPPDDREIFWAMQRYPDNVKVYHPHGSIDGTSVFWHNQLQPNALNFAAYVDPQAPDQSALFKRILNDLNKLADKFSDQQLITSDYAPQHAFNQWLTTQGFQLAQTLHLATVATKELPAAETAPEKAITVLSVADLKKAGLFEQFLSISLQAFQAQAVIRPATNLSKTAWQALICRQLILEIPSVAIDDNHQIMALSLAHQPVSGSAELRLVTGTNQLANQQLWAYQTKWLKTQVTTVSTYFQSADLLGQGIEQRLGQPRFTTYETYIQ